MSGPKKNFQQVLDASEKRRKNSGHKNNHISQVESFIRRFANNAKSLVDTAVKGGTQSTVAVGFYFDSEVIYGIYCGKIDEKAFRTACEASLEEDEYLGEIFEAKPQSGLHGEMAVLREMRNRFVENKSALDENVQIACLGKMVCPDCAGFMNSHKIGHISLFKEDSKHKLSFHCGDVSTMGGGYWEHPFTEAKYHGGNDINYYIKVLPNGTINRHHKN